MTQRTIRLPKSIYTLGTILRTDKRDDSPASFFEIAGTLGLLTFFAWVLFHGAKVIVALIGAAVIWMVTGRSFSSMTEAYAYGAITLVMIGLATPYAIKICKGFRFVPSK